MRHGRRRTTLQTFFLSFFLLLNLCGCGGTGQSKGLTSDGNLHFGLTSVLFIGDSHSVGFFGQSLDENMEKSLFNLVYVETYAVVGSSARSWNQDFICPAGQVCGLGPGYSRPSGDETSTGTGEPPVDFPALKGLEKTDKSEVVFLALGTNDAMQNCTNTSSTALQYVYSLLNLVKPDQRCVWVGPPTYLNGPLVNACTAKGYNSFVDRLQGAVTASRCLYVDSRTIRDLGIRSIDSVKKWSDCETSPTSIPLTSDAGDGIHFGQNKGRYWGVCVGRFLENIRSLSQPQPGSQQHGYEFLKLKN